MKISHRNAASSYWRPPESDPVDPRYETAVQAGTDRSEREYARLQHRLARAETRLQKARNDRLKPTRLAVLAALVELRREELEQYRRMMVSVPASAEHRGVKSFRPVPGPPAPL